MKDTAVILLASGLSRRFGSNKLMADLSGKPVVMHMADTISQYPFAARYAVIGAGDLRRTAALAYAGFTLIDNPDPSAGQGRSVAVGAARALEGGYNRALIVLADMPLVPAEHLKNLCAKEGDVVMSSLGDTKMPPALFSRAALKAIVKNEGVSAAVKSAALTVPISPNAALDIDTPADLIKVEAIMKQAHDHG